MTCREKAKIEHPECINIVFDGGVARCPATYGYLEIPDYCYNFWDKSRCDRCWDREIPEEKGPITEEKNPIVESKHKTLCDRCYSSGICKYSDDLNTFMHDIHNRFPFVTPDFKCEYFNDRKENV